MQIDTRAQPLSSDARAVMRQLEQLVKSQGGGAIMVGSNSLAAACRMDRRRVQEAMHLLTRRGIVSRVAPADPNIGRPASYGIATDQAVDQ